MRRPVLVFGADGLLGRELVRAFGQAGEVISATRPVCDITRLEDVLRLVEEVGPDLVANAAAFTRVDACEDEPERAYAVNALGARNVAVAAARVGAALVYFSTDYVFDGRKGSPYSEFDRPNPLSVYGRSKLAGEESVRSLCPRHYVVRTQWLYGRTGTSFVRTILNLAAAGQSPRVVADQFGSPTLAADLATAVARLTTRPGFGTYHLTNGGFCSWYSFAREIVNRAGLRSQVTPVSTAEVKRPAPRPAFSVLENLCWRLEGFEPLPDYRVALARFLESPREGDKT